TLAGDSYVRSVIPKLDPKDEAKNKEAIDLLGMTENGKPHDGMPNLANPKSVDFAVNAINESFKKDPKSDSFGIGADDGLPRDWRPESMKLNLNFTDIGGRYGVAAENSICEEWMAWINGIARGVHKTYPDAIITTNGYANRNTPPQGMSVEKNVWIM